MNRTRLTLSVTLLFVGLLGLIVTGPWTALATEVPPERAHERMHRMMDAVHGPGTSASMHQVEGMEGMMEACSGMMGAGMMNG